MRTVFLSFLLGVSISAIAGSPTTPAVPATQVVKCVSPMCGGLQDAILGSLADAGLASVDGFVTETDAKGNHWLTIVSKDARALSAIAPRSGARTIGIPNTTSYVRSIPLDLSDIDTITIPGVAGQVDMFLEIDGIDGGEGGGSEGGSTDGCYEVCECNESGIECWYYCP